MKRNVTRTFLLNGKNILEQKHCENVWGPGQELQFDHHVRSWSKGGCFRESGERYLQHRNNPDFHIVHTDQDGNVLNVLTPANR